MKEVDEKTIETKKIGKKNCNRCMMMTVYTRVVGPRQATGADIYFRLYSFCCCCSSIISFIFVYLFGTVTSSARNKTRKMMMTMIGN